MMSSMKLGEISDACRFIPNKYAGFSNIIIPSVLVISFCLSFLLYKPGFEGVFMMDDEPTLSALNVDGGVVSIEHLKQFVFGSTSGELGRPISMLSFLVEDQYWPGAAGDYKQTNFLLHLVCVLLVFIFIRTCLNTFKPVKHNDIVALAVAIFWLVHPMHISTVLYVVQRMTILMSLFALASLVCYVKGRSILIESPVKAYLSLFAAGMFAVASVFCKENGILILFYICVIEVTLFSNVKTDRIFRFLFTVAVGVPILVLLGYFLWKWGAFVRGYQFRDFTMIERVLTEQRILVEYLYQIVIPQPSVGSLIHDDYVVSKSLISPFTTLAALVFNVGVLCFALFKRKEYRVLSFAILWFYSGHILESTFIGLELYFEHRNYLPMLGPIFAIVYFIGSYFIRVTPSIKYCLSAGIGILFAWSCLVTAQTSEMWGSPSVLYRVWAKEHQESPRAQRIYGQLLGVEGAYKESVDQLLLTHEKFPYDVGVLIDALNIACANNLPQPLSIDALASKIKQARYVDGLMYYVESLFDAVSNDECSYLSLDDVHSIISDLKELPRLPGKVKAQLLFYGARISISEGDLNAAMLALDEASERHKNPALPLLQSKLLLSAGLIEESVSFLHKAEELALIHSNKYAVAIEDIKKQKIKLSKLKNGYKNK